MGTQWPLASLDRKAASYLTSTAPLKVLLICLFFLIALYRSFDNLFPSLERLGRGDELAYINNGRLITERVLPPFSWGPAVSAFYAGIYLPFRNSPNWVLPVTWVGHQVIFLLLFTAGVLVSLRLRPHTGPVAFASILAIGSPALMTLVRNSSDGLFASFAALTLWQVLGWLEDRHSRHLAAVSVLWSVCALTRVDGWALAPLLVVGVVSLSWRRSLGARWKTLLREGVLLTIPGVVVVAVALLLSTGRNGQFGLGVRVYSAFEHGQGVVYAGSQSQDDNADRRMAAEVYGTEEENGGSVLRAILRNPRAFCDRVWRSATYLPSLLLDAYGNAIAVFVFLLAGVGLTRLVRKRAWCKLGWLAIWPLPLMMYFVTFFRSGYLALPFVAVFACASIGLGSIVSVKGTIPLEEALASVLLAGVGVWGAAAGKVGWLLLGVLGSGWLVGVWLIRWWHVTQTWSVCFTAVMICALVVPSSMEAHSIPRIGSSEEEEAARWIVAHYPPDTRIAENHSQISALSRMPYVGFPNPGLGNEIAEWMEGEQARLLVVNTALDLQTLDSAGSPDKPPRCLSLVYVSPAKRVVIWEAQPSCKEMQPSGS